MQTASEEALLVDHRSRAPVSKVLVLVIIQARVQQLPVDVVKVQVCSRPTESYEKADDLNKDCHQVYELKCDENYEASMISRPNTAI